MSLKTQFIHPNHDECFTCTDCRETMPRREVDANGRVTRINFRDVAAPSVCNACLAKRRTERKARRTFKPLGLAVSRGKVNGEGRNVKVAVYLNEQENDLLDYLAYRHDIPKSVILTTAFNRFCEESLTHEDRERARRWKEFKMEMRGASPATGQNGS
jgi:hypothetical protein